MSEPSNIVSPSFFVSTLRGLRNGMYYGGKVRFTHALVMTLLFRKGPMKEKMKSIFQLTWQHARNLGCYVFLYKAIVYILNKLRGRTSKYHAFIGGVIAGYIIFRNKTSVNYQIVLYLFSRVIMGSAENLVKKKKLPDISTFPALAAICWGLVMFLFEDDSSSLQSSLTSSMEFLYRDSETWRSWTDFVPFRIPQALLEVINKIIASSRGSN